MENTKMYVDKSYDSKIKLEKFKLAEILINPELLKIAKRGSNMSWHMREIYNHDKVTNNVKKSINEI